MGAYVNSTDVKFDKSFISCGVVELHHLPSKSPQKSMFQLANHLYHKANPRPAAYAIFSDVITKGEEGRGEKLAFYLKERNVGLLWTSDTQINPKTGNHICLWVLSIDHTKFRAWYAEESMHRIDTE